MSVKEEMRKGNSSPFIIKAVFYIIIARAGLLQETAKKVPDQLLVWGVEASEGPEGFQTDSKWVYVNPIII